MAEDERNLYQKKRILVPMIVLIVCLVLGGIYWFINFFDYVDTDDAYIDGDNVNVSAKILGRVSALKVDEGDTVNAGQVLALLDDSDLRAQEKQDQASLEYARRNQQLAKVNLDKLHDDFTRAKVQFDSNIIAKEQYDHAQKAWQAAQVQNKVAQAQIDTAEAQLGVIKTQLGNTVIKAPLAGVIAKRWVLAGTVVQAAQPIYALNNLRNIWVTANLEETKFYKLKLGQKAEMTVDSYPGVKYHGEVIQLGSNTAAQFSLIPPNNASGNFTKVTQRIPVKISIDNSPTSLLPGMSVYVKVRVK